jgi:hypothetical protein
MRIFGASSPALNSRTQGKLEKVLTIEGVKAVNIVVWPTEMRSLSDGFRIQKTNFRAKGRVRAASSTSEARILGLIA